MILYTENPNDATKKLLELTNEYGEVAEYKINIQKSVVFTLNYGLPRLVVKNLSANSGDIRNVGLIPGLGRSPGGGHSNPLQYSCLENPMDRGA